MAYRIFPTWLIEPVLRREPVQVGDTVGALLWLPLGFRLFFASRVVATFDEMHGGIWRTGFTYATLVGHPELGEETFSVEKDLQTGEIAVALRSWSVSGLWLTRIFEPFARWLQRFANNAALNNLETIA
jgi:uncharacterized protein (UPF0548 family)